MAIDENCRDGTCWIENLVNFREAVEAKRERQQTYSKYNLSPLVKKRTANPQEADIQNMEMLGFSRFNPYYILARIKQYFSKK